MPAFELGVALEALERPLRGAIDEAARLGVRGVQFTPIGELHPDQLGATARRDLHVKIRHCNLSLAGLLAPLRRGIDTFADQEPRLAQITKVMSLSWDLGSTIVIVPMPSLPTADADPRAVTLRESLVHLARQSNRLGVRVALECGLDDGPTVAKYLDGFDPGLCVAFDPANFLVNGHDPVASLIALGKHVVYVQARDARRGSLSGGVREVATGAGDVDWLTVAATLECMDYQGYGVVDREDGPTRPADIASGVNFLRRFARLHHG
jgi:L-ribulose-5-phosphate 3-epimerase